MMFEIKGRLVRVPAAILLVLLCANASAGWNYVVSGEAGAVYFSDDEANRDGDVITVWVSVIYNKAQITGTKKQITRKEYDCRRSTSKTLKMKTYDSSDNHTDTINYELNWHSKVDPLSIDGNVMNAVCSRFYK